MGFQGQVGVGFPEIVRQGQGLGLADLAGLVLLAVEVGQVHPVKVQEDQLPHPRPGQGEGQVRPQPAQATDGHGGGREFGLEGPGRGGPPGRPARPQG